MLIVLELVEAGAGGGEKDNISGDSRCGGMFDGSFQSFRVVDFGGAVDL